MSVYKVFGRLNFETQISDSALVRVGLTFLEEAKLPDQQALVISRQGFPIYVITKEDEPT